LLWARRVVEEPAIANRAIAANRKERFMCDPPWVE
jgi:hypothetical protein